MPIWDAGSDYCYSTCTCMCTWGQTHRLPLPQTCPPYPRHRQVKDIKPRVQLHCTCTCSSRQMVRYEDRAHVISFSIISQQHMYSVCTSSHFLLAQDSCLSSFLGWTQKHRIIWSTHASSVNDFSSITRQNTKIKFTICFSKFPLFLVKSFPESLLQNVKPLL